MVRRDEDSWLNRLRRRGQQFFSFASPAGASPVQGTAGDPGSRSPTAGEIPSVEARRQEPLRREQQRGPQHQVKPAASTEKQWEGRAGHVTAKAAPDEHEPGAERSLGLPGVWGAARVEGDTRNTGDPSASLLSQQDATNKLIVKSCIVQRGSERVVVPHGAQPTKATQQNVVGGRDPCFGYGVEAGKREGMAGRSGPNNPEAHKGVDKVQQLQRRLWIAAKRDPGRRFHALYDRIHRRDVLWEAWRRVRANRGAGGVDRETIALVEQRGVEDFLSDIEGTLRRGEYRPRAVLRRYIPKADGKKRPLGIPTVRDRVVQMATKLVIEPIFEADFLPSSFGFRPKRSATQGLEVHRLEGGKNHVVDADIRDYFGSIDQSKLLKLVEKRVSDRRVLKLCRQWLEAGVMLPPEEGGKVSPTTSGTPQGGVISPLHSNIYLHVLDDVWARKCSHLGTLVRYADDFVVMSSTSAQCVEAERRIGVVLQRLGLELHPDKTRRVDLSRGREGFDFLGCHLHKRLSGRILEKEGRHVHFLHRWPSQRSMKRVRERVREQTGADRGGVKDVRVLIKDLNPILRGWGNYFKTGNAASKFNQVDSYVHERLRNFMIRRKGRHLKAGQASTWTRDFFVNLGLHRLRGTVEYPGQRRKLQSENPSLSRVREIRTHGLKGGSTLSSSIQSKMKG